MAITQEFYNSITTPTASGFSYSNEPITGKSNPFDFNQYQQPEENPGSVLDFVGASLWGVGSAFTFGATEFVNPYAEDPWEERSGYAKAGMILGEGLGLFAPWGAFGMLGKAGRVATKAAGANKFIGKASKNAISGLSKKSTVELFKDSPDVAKNILNAADALAKKKGITQDAVLKAYGDDIISGLNNVSKNDLSVGWIKNLHKTGATYRDSKNQLITAGSRSIKQAFEKNGIKIADSEAKFISSKWANELKDGKYVNDIAEWVERTIGGSAPGAVRESVSKYLGMATQDLALMTTHGLIMGAVKNAATGEHFDPMESLSHSAMMALAFPLIRSIPGGGKDNLMTGFNAYFSRYKGYNYKKLANESGDDVVRNLLRLQTNAPEKRAAWNWAIADRTWTVGKGAARKVYSSADDISRNLETMPMDHVFEILNKINKKVSSDMLSKWAPKYLWDFTKSLPRMVGGTVMTNPWMMERGAWGAMDSQELGAHVMMSFMMTKGRGAWNPNKKQIYFKDFANHRSALEALNVKPETAEQLHGMYMYRNGKIASGEHMGSTRMGSKLSEAYDKVLDVQNKNESFERPNSTSEELMLVTQFAGAYDNIKQASNPNHRNLSDGIHNLSKDAVNKIAKNIREINVAGENAAPEYLGSFGRDAYWQGLMRMSMEPLSKGIKTYKSMFKELGDLGFDIQVLNDGTIDWASTRTTKSGSDGIGRMTEINAVLKGFERFGDANRERSPASNQEKTMEIVAKENGIRVKDLQAKVSEIVDRHMEIISSGFNNNGEYYSAHKNNFLTFYGSAKEVAVHDRLYKLIVGKGLKGDKQLTEALDNMFMINGRYAHNITDYKSRIEGLLETAKEGTKEREVLDKSLEYLMTLEPIFSLRKAHLGGGTVKRPSSKIELSQLEAAVNSLNRLFGTLPVKTQQNFNSEIGQVYMERILYNKGMDSRALKLSHFLIEHRLAVYREGEIIIPDPEIMKQHLIDQSRGKVSQDELNQFDKALVTIKNVMGNNVKFTKKMPVDESGAVLTDGINTSKYVEAFKILGNESTSQILMSAKDAISDIRKIMGGRTKELEQINNDIINVIDQLEGRPGDYKNKPIEALSKIGKQLDLIRESAKDPRLAIDKKTETQQDIDDLAVLLKQLSDGINAQTGKWDVSLAGMKKLVQGESWNQETDPTQIIELIRTPMQTKIDMIFNRETQGRRQLSEVLTRLETVVLQGKKSYGLNVEDTAFIVDKLTREWNTLYTKEVNSGQKSLGELIELTQKTGSFGDITKILTEVSKEIRTRQILNNKNHPLNSEEALMRETMDKGHAEKTSRAKTPQEILRDYGLVNKDNEINSDFKNGMLSFSPSTMFRTMRKHIFENYIDKQDISAKDKAAEFTNFRNKDAITILNYLDSQTTIPTVSITAAGGAKTQAIVNFNNAKTGVRSPNVGYFENKGFKTLFLDDAISTQAFGKLRTTSLDMGMNNPRLVQKIINESLRTSSSNKELLQGLKERLELTEPEVLKLLRQENIDQNFFYARVSPSSRILFVATEKNINALNRDFNTWYDNTLKRYKNDGKNNLANTLESVFGGLRTKQELGQEARRIVEQKMLVPYLDRMGSRSNFEKWLETYASETGTSKDLAKIEANLFKRGYLTDGGTTMPMSRRTLEYIVGRSVTPSGNIRYLGHTSPEIRATAEKLLKNDGFKSTVFNDDVAGKVHPFNIKEIVKNEIKADIKKIAATADKELLSILEENVKTNESIKSLDNSLFDGAKFASLETMRFIMAQKGVEVNEFINSPNGAKTIIFATGDNQMLGKGYMIYHPEVAKNMPKGVDIALGSESAKTFSGVSSNGQPFQALDVSTGLSALRSARNRNTMTIPIESIGVSFMSKNSDGGVISPSIFDFQSPNTVKNAMSWMKFEQTYQNIANDWNASNNIGRSYVSWLKKVNMEGGNPLDKGDIGMARIMFEFGADPNTPLIIPAIKRLMRSKHYEELNTIENFRGGEDNFLVPNVKADLKSPIHVRTREKSFGSEPDINSRTVMQFGETAINQNQAKRTLGKTVGRANIQDEMFIFRDKNGVDILTKFDGKNFEFESNFLSRFQRNKNDNQIIGVENGKTVYKDGSKYTYNTVKGKRSYFEIERTLKELNEKVSAFNLNYKEALQLLKGNSVNKSVNGVFKTTKLTARAIDDSKNFNLTFGMLGHAIPAIGHDKTMLRVKRVSERLNGLAEVNVHDLRVALQRDNDGDHFYMHQKLPWDMAVNFAKQQGKKTDFNIFNTDHVLNSEYINIFGVSETTGKAAGIAGGGFQKYASTLTLAKKAIGSTIGTRNAMSWLDRTGITFGKDRFLHKFWDENSNTFNKDSWKFLQKYYDVMQNSVDIHSGIHELIRNNKALNDFLFFGNVEQSIFSRAKQEIAENRGDNILNKYISEGSTPFKNKDFGNKAIEREIFYTLLRTLKKANMISNDVYDEAGSRNPEPFEIRSAYNELNQLFTNPNQFLAGKTKSLIAFRMNDSDKARRAEGQKLAGEWIEMFTPENLLKNRATFGDRVALYKNFITKGEYFLPKNVFGFENVSMLDVGNTTGAKNPFMMSLGGHHLWKLANMDGFHSKGIEGLERIQLQKGTNFERAGMFVDKIEQFVETAVMYGESRDGFANKLMSRVNQDGTFEFKLNGDSFGNQGVFSIKESMNNGILRNLIERQMKEIQTSIEYFRAENFTNPNKIERFTNRLANLKVAADIMDLQTVRDITIPSKDYIFNQSNYQKFGEKKFVNLAKKQGKKGTVAVWRLKGDVKSTNISELKWGDKGANNLSDLRFTDVNLSEGAKFVNQKQLEFVGYFNAKSRKVGDLYAGYTYIVDTKPKKYVNISDKELKWNRALFKATYGDETANYFLRESSRAEEFYKDLKSLRAEISTGYFTTVKNSLANKVLSKDIFAFNDVQEGFAINKFMKKWRNELVDSADPVDFLLRNILKPQKAPTYTSDDKGQYIPNFTTNNHLQKTVLKWAIESEGGQNRGFLEPFIKDVQGYYEGSKSFKTNDYVKAHRGQINYDYAGGTATQTMLKYLDVFYANPTMEYNLSRRMNETIGINRSFKDQSGQQYEYLQGRPIRRKPEDFKGKWDNVSDQNGKGC